MIIIDLKPLETVNASSHETVKPLESRSGLHILEEICTICCARVFNSKYIDVVEMVGLKVPS